MLSLRIFLSSPGDLGPERLAARQVVDALQRGPVWSGKVHLDLVAWDDPLASVPMEVHTTPQLSVNRYRGLPRDCDLTLVLLWGRLGTPLPADQVRKDGTPFPSGTVWELEDALSGPRPVWLFHCTRPVQIDADAPDFAEQLAQRKAVKAFLQQFKDVNGAITGGGTPFGSCEDFAEKLSQQLNAELRRLQDAQAPSAAAAGPASSAEAAAAVLPLPLPTAWGFGAYMASKRAQFVGRDWLFAQIEAWLAQPQPRALLVRADFGVGKSALMAEFIHRDAQRPAGQQRVLAWHFCQHDTRQTLRPAVFVRSLAAQLAARLPAYRSALLAAPELLAQLARASDDPGSALEAAVINPLAAMDPAPGTRLLLIDALDESLEVQAEAADHTPGAATTTATIVALLAAKASRLPPWLRLLVTSRNNPAVVGRLKAGFGLQEIDAEAGLNLDDITRYVLMRCAESPLAQRLLAAGHSAAAIAAALRDKSGGKFLYAVRALDDLASGLISAADLQHLPPGMDGFYLDAFERRFSRAGRAYGPAAALLGVMAAAREPLAPTELVVVLAGAGELFVTAQQTVSEVETALKALRADALSDFIRVRDGVWAFDHFSLREWLSDEDGEGNPRAGPFAVNLWAARKGLVAWGSARILANGTACSSHVLRHHCAYLQLLGRDAERRALLHSLRWLDAKLVRLGTSALLADFDEGDAADNLTLLGRTLAMCAHILDRQPAQLAAQLLGRLPAGQGAALDSLLAECAARTGAAWLRPLVPSLSPPGHLLRVLHGHSDVVQHAIFSADGELILTASADATARIWRRSGELVAELLGHSAALNHVALSPDGDTVATAAEDRSVRLWRRNGEPLACFEFDYSVIAALFSANGQQLLVLPRHREARLIDLQGSLLATLTGHRRAISSARFSPDGDAIVTGSNDGTARLWSAAGEPAATLTGHSDGVTGVCFSPDGSRVLTTSLDRTARLWQRDGTCLASLAGHGEVVNHGSFSADGQRLLTASNDNSARLWHSDGTAGPVLRGHGGWVNQASFSPDGQTIATVASDNDLRLWSAQGELRAELRGHTGWVLHSAFSADGRHLLTCSRDQTARLWRSDARQLPARDGHDAELTQVAASADGQRVLSGACDNTARLWLADGRPLAVLAGHSDWVTQVAFSPDGQCLLTASCDGSARLWTPEGLPQAQLQGHEASINQAAFSADGQRVLTASNDGTARIWRLGRAGSLCLAGHEDAVNQVTASPDGAWIVTASNDNTARLWHADGRCAAVLTGHEGWVLQACFAADGQSVLTASVDGTVRRWGLGGQALGRLASGAAPVSLLRVHGASGSLAVGARDGSLRVWRGGAAPPGAAAALGQHRAALTALAFGPDAPDGGITLASGAEDGELRVQTLMPDGRLADALSLDLDAPVMGLACHGDRVFCGDALGHVHFLLRVAGGHPSSGG